MASLDWRQGPLEDAGRGPQSRARLAAAVKRQKTELVSHVSLMLMMMMMMMTLVKFVNSGTKIRPGIDKFYQPNSGLRSSKTEDKAIQAPKIGHLSGLCVIYLSWMLVDSN